MDTPALVRLADNSEDICGRIQQSELNNKFMGIEVTNLAPGNTPFILTETTEVSSSYPNFNMIIFAVSTVFLEPVSR